METACIASGIWFIVVSLFLFADFICGLLVRSSRQTQGEVVSADVVDPDANMPYTRIAPEARENSRYIKRVRYKYGENLDRTADRIRFGRAEIVDLKEAEQWLSKMRPGTPLVVYCRSRFPYLPCLMKDCNDRYHSLCMAPAMFGLGLLLCGIGLGVIHP